jgi:hypothetical protein
MLAGALLIPLDVVRAEPELIMKDQVLFKRFFYVANGFYPNEQQMQWFGNYKDGVTHQTRGPRQSGVTTFMLTLALYESKCNGSHVALCPQNHEMTRLCRERIIKMSDRLGKSVKDGPIVYLTSADQRIGNPDAKVFVMNDANRYPEAYSFNTYALHKVYFFGTAETRPYKGSEYEGKIIY